MCHAAAMRRLQNVQGKFHSLPMLHGVFPAPLGNLLRQVVSPAYCLIRRPAEKGENVKQVGIVDFGGYVVVPRYDD